jgi:nitrogen fixation NifU-like protein
MTTDLNQLAEELQQQILRDAQKIYSDKVIEEFYNPNNLGRMPNPDAHGLVHGWCGDTMEIYLRLNGEKIEQASFTTDGCGSTVACGSMLTRMVTGMSLEKASAVQPQDLLKALDGLPEENAHCATLAVNTLQNAISRARSAEPEGQND